jgi:hypothetical protein
MRAGIKSVQKTWTQLPQPMRQEALDFIQFLMTKAERNRTRQARSPLDFEWEGALSHLKETSVELQKKALGWR